MAGRMGSATPGKALEIALGSLRWLLGQHLGFGQIGEGGTEMLAAGLRGLTMEAVRGISR
jgi:hypothetical protein